MSLFLSLSQCLSVSLSCPLARSLSRSHSLSPVSVFAAEEFEVLQDDLSLERDLRTEAEKFAREVNQLFP